MRLRGHIAKAGKAEPRWAERLAELAGLTLGTGAARAAAELARDARRAVAEAKPKAEKERCRSYWAWVDEQRRKGGGALHNLIKERCFL